MTRTATQSGKRLAYEERLARALAWKPKAFALKHAQLIVEARSGGAGLVKLAEKLAVDPRWLATAERSAASYEATKRLQLCPALRELPEATARQLIDALELIPEAAPYPSVCRYCGCTDEHGCGDCTWVDRAHTICSSCLEES